MEGCSKFLPVLLSYVSVRPRRQQHPRVPYMLLRHFQCCTTNFIEGYLKPCGTQTFEYLDAYPNFRSDTGKHYVYTTETAKACSEFTLSQRF